MNNFQSFDDRNNGAGIAGSLVGSLAGAGIFLLVLREWWAWGWGPGHWNRSAILHAYWLAFWGNLNPAYEGDYGTWGALKLRLLSHHVFDSFVASFWIPFLMGTSVGILTSWLVVRAINRKGPAYVRGSRIN